MVFYDLLKPWATCRLGAANQLRQFKGFAVLVGLAIALPFGALTAPEAIAQTGSAACSQPALSRLTRHRVAQGETLAAIAQRYSLLPATIMGLNPAVQGGAVSPGQELLIPPFNGIRVSVARGQTWQQVAQAYNSRPDVLFEVNGCVSTVPATIFLPGVNWFPGVSTTAATAAAPATPLQGYPLPQRSQVIVNYGWQPDPAQGKLVFNTGVALASSASTPALAVGAGTVAFAGTDATYGNLVVVNHAQGLQTRYANLAALNVRVGQTVRQGDRLGAIATSEGDDAFLFFEVRLNSTAGWVAQDPQDYVPTMVLR
ncbi:MULTISPECIES: M23 family metallopeptidase [Cyanophyceae]|uniref:LysM peptidoglycan-binding domain-containing M23 family metallopeptidase n=1 Tax=Cyanophyceae TaxID=3028117 RepID=UPI001683EBD8|nr:MULTISPECIES: M23 family metallopeptidase [Cyanophyceae]MBD1915808.1 M23 family metallopeptidase [Phormidium sp. FACHB-77]MBD2030518.1 M23 family metallopeptidase [Phormidium sp. FACHB-322]MBD2053520.1 M23 family metallopeptidase [Leptolyngbya sp. FACHB-60]